MADMELLFPSKYLKACDLLAREHTVTIEHIELGELTMRGGTTKKRGLIRMAGAEKLLVLNRTNAESIAKLYGRDTAAWIGKRVTLYPARVSFGRDTVDAIRVREVVPRAKSSSPRREPGEDCDAEETTT